MLARMWRKRNTPPLLVELQACTTSPRHISRKCSGKKDTCSSMFIAALFVIARSWKEPRCLSIGECQGQEVGVGGLGAGEGGGFRGFLEKKLERRK